MTERTTICPHCGYKGGGGTYGEFFKLNALMERSYGWMRGSPAALLGCPCCKKTFIKEVR